MYLWYILMDCFNRKFVVFFIIAIIVIDKPGYTQDDRDMDFNPVGCFISSFWKHISKVDGKECPSYPPCSSYSILAFKKHGFIMGWLMTVDRLIHEGKEELTVSPMTYYHGKIKIYDPVENNDFWWYKPKKRYPIYYK